MVLPNISDFPEAPVCSPEQTDGPFAVLTEDRREEPQLAELAERYGPRLLVPEVRCADLLRRIRWDLPPPDGNRRTQLSPTLLAADRSDGRSISSSLFRWKRE